MAILYPTSLANLVVEVGTRHCHQTLLGAVFTKASAHGRVFDTLSHSAKLQIVNFLWACWHRDSNWWSLKPLAYSSEISWFYYDTYYSSLSSSAEIALVLHIQSWGMGLSWTMITNWQQWNENRHNRACHPGGHSCNLFPGVLYL